MHTGGLTLFLVGVAVIGLAPLLFLVVYLARRASDARRDDGNEVRVGSVGALRTVSIGLAGVAVLAAAVAWYLSSAGETGSVPRMDGMPMGGSETQASLGILPRTLAGLPMTEEVTGPDAVSEVAKLHGSDFPISSAEIAQYAGGRAMVWVSMSADAATSATMAEDMAARIAEGGSPFDPPKALPGEEGVWVTHGRGQVHYFFARGDEVWWLSADRGIARLALSEVLEVAG